MLYRSVEDFYRQTQAISRLTREEEEDCVRRMLQGDAAARECLIRQYLPLAAALIRKAPPPIQTLHTVYSAVAAVEKSVDTFDFTQTSEPFVHRVNWVLRQCIVRCIAER